MMKVKGNIEVSANKFHREAKIGRPEELNCNDFNACLTDKTDKLR